MTRRLAVYDGSNNLLMRFEYADAGMPFAMTTDSGTYFLAYDQVGSLRVVADGSGNPVKRIDYDSFGNVFYDSDPDFPVPFGFAGGLYDKDTKLVRFGFRDYDPDTGRWTAKDPIGFAGGDTDLYGYCVNDPVNWIDPDGLSYAGQYAATGAAVGGIVTAGLSVAADAATGGLNVVATPAEIAAGSALGSAIGYGIGSIIDGLLTSSHPITVQELENSVKTRKEHLKKTKCLTQTPWQGPGKKFDPNEPPQNAPWWKKAVYAAGRIIKVIKGWPH